MSNPKRPTLSFRACHACLCYCHWSALQTRLLQQVRARASDDARWRHVVLRLCETWGNCEPTDVPWSWHYMCELLFVCILYIVDPYGTMWATNAKSNSMVVLSRCLFVIQKLKCVCVVTSFRTMSLKSENLWNSTLPYWATLEFAIDWLNRQMCTLLCRKCVKTGATADWLWRHEGY